MLKVVLTTLTLVLVLYMETHLWNFISFLFWFYHIARKTPPIEVHISKPKENGDHIDNQVASFLAVSNTHEEGWGGW